jgi:AbrB family looped-hinge helix DNA binding protein
VAKTNLPAILQQHDLEFVRSQEAGHLFRWTKWPGLGGTEDHRNGREPPHGREASSGIRVAGAGSALISSDLSSLLCWLTIQSVQATLTSKGQITIPVQIRQRLHLKPGDVLEFDESAPFLKATKTIPPHAWEAFSQGWQDPWPGLTLNEVMDDLRGAVALPPDAAP